MRYGEYLASQTEAFVPLFEPDDFVRYEELKKIAESEQDPDFFFDTWEAELMRITGVVRTRMESQDLSADDQDRILQFTALQREGLRKLSKKFDKNMQRAAMKMTGESLPVDTDRVVARHFSGSGDEGEENQADSGTVHTEAPELSPSPELGPSSDISPLIGAYYPQQNIRLRMVDAVL